MKGYKAVDALGFIFCGYRVGKAVRTVGHPVRKLANFPMLFCDHVAQYLT